MTRGDDWFQPFRVLDDNGDDVTASCAVIAQARVKRASDASRGRAAGGVGPIVGGRWAGYHEIHADREDTRTWWRQVGDWEMGDHPAGRHGLARTIVGGPLPVAPADHCPVPLGVELMALAIEFRSGSIDGRSSSAGLVVVGQH